MTHLCTEAFVVEARCLVVVGADTGAERECRNITRASHIDVFVSSFFFNAAGPNRVIVLHGVGKNFFRVEQWQTAVAEGCTENSSSAEQIQKLRQVDQRENRIVFGVDNTQFIASNLRFGFIDVEFGNFAGFKQLAATGEFVVGYCRLMLATRTISDA